MAAGASPSAKAHRAGGASGARPRASLGVFALLAASCGGATPSPPVAREPAPGRAASSEVDVADAGPEPPPGAPRRAPLRFDTAVRAVGIPLVQARVAGEPTLLAVDTGASAHVVAGWLARRLALRAREAAVQGADHAGRTVEVRLAEARDLVVLPGVGLAVHQALVTEVPPVLEELGIGGLLSPQLLTTPGTRVVLDVAGAELRVEATGDAEPAVAPVLRVRSTCEEHDAPVRSRAFVAPATLNGKSARLLVDTGAAHTDVFAASVAGRALAAHAKRDGDTRWAAGGRVDVRTARGVDVALGSGAAARRLRLDVDVLAGAADGSCPRDGVLGLDALRACALVFEGASLAIRCRD